MKGTQRFRVRQIVDGKCADTPHHWNFMGKRSDGNSVFTCAKCQLMRILCVHSAELLISSKKGQLQCSFCGHFGCELEHPGFIYRGGNASRFLP